MSTPTAPALLSLPSTHRTLTAHGHYYSHRNHKQAHKIIRTLRIDIANYNREDDIEDTMEESG